MQYYCIYWYWHWPRLIAALEGRTGEILEDDEAEVELLLRILGWEDDNEGGMTLVEGTEGVLEDEVEELEEEVDVVSACDDEWAEWSMGGGSDMNCLNPENGEMRIRNEELNVTCTISTV